MYAGKEWHLGKVLLHGSWCARTAQPNPSKIFSLSGTETRTSSNIKALKQMKPDSERDLRHSRQLLHIRDFTAACPHFSRVLLAERVFLPRPEDNTHRATQAFQPLQGELHCSCRCRLPGQGASADPSLPSHLMPGFLLGHARLWSQLCAHPRASALTCGTDQCPRAALPRHLAMVHFPDGSPFFQLCPLILLPSPKQLA